MGKKMPEKDPVVWELLSALKDHGLAALLAFVLTWVRILYDDKEPRTVRRLIEATLGGLIAVAVGLTCDEFGLSAGWSYFSASFVGLIGVDQVRSLARKWAERKAGP